MRVRSDKRPGFVWLDVARGDTLDEPVAQADLDDSDEVARASLDRVVVGWREDGRPWIAYVWTGT